MRYETRQKLAAALVVAALCLEGFALYLIYRAMNR